MQYLNNSFWRMIIGLIVVLAMGIAFLISNQIYGSGNALPENYMAGSKEE